MTGPSRGVRVDVPQTKNEQRPTHVHERDVIAEYLLTHVGGDDQEAWQAGHNYAMAEAARLVREQWHLLEYGRLLTCPDCGREGPHTGPVTTSGWIECGTSDKDGYDGCGASWPVDQRNIFPGLALTYDD